VTYNGNKSYSVAVAVAAIAVAFLIIVCPALVVILLLLVVRLLDPTTAEDSHLTREAVLVRLGNIVLSTLFLGRERSWVFDFELQGPSVRARERLAVPHVP
jgi:hypothetical protein